MSAAGFAPGQAARDVAAGLTWEHAERAAAAEVTNPTTEDYDHAAKIMRLRDQLDTAKAALKRLADLDYNPDKPGEQTYEIAADALMAIADGTPAVTAPEPETSTTAGQDQVQAAAEVLYRDYDSQYSAEHPSWRDFADLARQVLAAAQQPQPAPAADWWVCTGPLTVADSQKIIGPFATQELALTVRSHVEKAEHRTDLWVDDEARPQPADNSILLSGPRSEGVSEQPQAAPGLDPR